MKSYTTHPDPKAFTYPDKFNRCRLFPKEHVGQVMSGLPNYATFKIGTRERIGINLAKMEFNCCFTREMSSSLGGGYDD